MDIQTYLFFNGCCEEAIRFYGEVFGAEVAFLMRYKEGPPNLMRPGSGEKIYHATLKFGETTLNMNDALTGEHGGMGGFALLVHFAAVEDAGRVFAALAQRGQVRMPLAQSPWARLYGIVQDPFGITWKIQVNG
jgi:PhnB protein